LIRCTQTNRTFTVAYCIFDYVYTAGYAGLLARYRKKIELLLGLVSGTGMLIAELILIHLGARVVITPSYFPPTLVLVAIGFDPTFVFISATYTLLSLLLAPLSLEERRSSRITLAFALLGWFLYPLGMDLHWNGLGATITIIRWMPSWAHILEVALTVVFFALNWLQGVRKEATICFFGGAFMNACFEGGMLLYGVRWYVGAFWTKLLLHVFFELNAGVMTALFFTASLGLLQQPLSLSRRGTDV